MLKPAYKLKFGPKSEGGGLLAAASTAASGLGLGGGGGKVIDTTDEPQASTVIELTVALDIDTPADSVTLLMGQVGALRPERDGVITVELGYEDDEELTQVMTGTIVTVEPGLTMRRVVGHSAVHQLLRGSMEQMHEDTTAGEIVRAVAEEAGVEVENAEDGITFPAYVIDGRRNLYRHMRDLADLCGFDVYVNPEGKLVFEKFTGGEVVHVFDYAKQIIELDVLQTAPIAGEVQAWGESPGGKKSPEDWAWLTKDFEGLKGSASADAPLLLLERPAIRTAKAARTAAEARERVIRRRAIRGRLLVQGQPGVRLGDAIRLRDVPEESLNDTFQVRSVTHRIVKKSGFTTTIDFRSKAT